MICALIRIKVVFPWSHMKNCLNPEKWRGLFLSLRFNYKCPTLLVELVILLQKLVIAPVKKELGPAFKNHSGMVAEALEAMDENKAIELKETLDSKGEADFRVCTLDKVVAIKKSMVSISKEIKKEHQRVFTPSVIEPSFGIERIIYCLYEHSFYMRPSKDGDEQLSVFRFSTLVDPIKCTVFPLVQNQEYEAVAKKIAKSLLAVGISYKVDVAGTSLGKRYARTDELGVPFAITVDSTSSVNHT